GTPIAFLRPLVRCRSATFPPSHVRRRRPPLEPCRWGVGFAGATPPPPRSTPFAKYVRLNVVFIVSSFPHLQICELQRCIHLVLLSLAKYVRSSDVFISSPSP